ncbi:MAG: cytochrome c maturation protein CcmE [Acidimicrobiia bacterium]|nr:cytochrome c maturation protein CcmE [Acidimicrobiia bacterium]
MDELTGTTDPDDVGQTDAATDLTPRVAPAARRRRRKPWAFVALLVIVAALLVVVMNGLGDATMFFRNTDEAVAQRESLDDRRFRIQGRVESGSIRSTTSGVDFVISHNGVEVTVAHRGDQPPDLFQENIPVVLEGRWAKVDDPDVSAPAADVPTDDGWFFASDKFFVKHEENYVAENPERIDDYDDDGGAGDGDDGDVEDAPTP